MDMLGGGGSSKRLAKKICSGFCILSRERARERDSEFLSAIDISPLPHSTASFALSNNPKQNTTVSGSTWISSLVHPLSSFSPSKDLQPKLCFPNRTKFWSSLRSLLLPPSKLSALFFFKFIYLINLSNF
jgi:hypothetical protein